MEIISLTGSDSDSQPITIFTKKKLLLCQWMFSVIQLKESFWLKKIQLDFCYFSFILLHVISKRLLQFWLLLCYTDLIHHNHVTATEEQIMQQIYSSIVQCGCLWCSWKLGLWCCLHGVFTCIAVKTMCDGEWMHLSWSTHRICRFRSIIKHLMAACLSWLTPVP